MIDVIIAKLRMNAETHTDRHVKCMFYLSEFKRNLNGQFLAEFCNCKFDEDFSAVLESMYLYRRTVGRTDGRRDKASLIGTSQGGERSVASS